MADPSITDLMSPDKVRALRLDLQQLTKDGHGEAELRDYVRGFKEGLLTTGVNTSIGPIANGVLMGYGDELKGAVRSTFTGNSRLYETARARGQLARARNDAPIGSTVGEVAGSLASGVLGGGAIGAAGKGASLLANVGKATAAGAATGGLYSSGDAVGGAEARLGAAVPGAVVGGAVGAVLAPVAATLGGIGRKVLAAATESGGEAKAVNTMRDLLEQTNSNGVNIASRLRAAQREGLPLTTFEAMGKPGVDLMEHVAQTPGRGREQVVEQLGERQIGQSGRILDMLKKYSGVDASSVGAKQAVAQARSAAAQENYGKLGSVDTPDDIMQHVRNLLQTKDGRDAYRRAARFSEQAGVRGEPNGSLPPLDTILNGGRLTVGETDKILQGISASAERKMVPGMVPGSKAETAESLDLNKTAGWLSDMLKQRSPEFAKARADWAAPTQFIKSIDLGRQLAAKPLDDFKAAWGNASSAQQDGMTIGFVNHLKAALEDFSAGETANAARLLESKPALREKLRLVLGPQADDFLTGLTREMQTSKNAAQAVGNSATARRQATERMMAEEPMGALPTTAHGIWNRVTGWLDEKTKEKTRAALARLGMETDPDLAYSLVEQALNTRPPPSGAGGVGGALGAPAGAFAGAVVDKK